MDQPLLQPAIALCFVYAGIIMGLVYAVCTAIQNALHKAWLRNILDGLYAIFSFLIFAVVSIFTTGGTMRFYCFLAAAIGFWIERTVIHALIVSLHLKRIHKSASHSS